MKIWNGNPAKTRFFLHVPNQPANDQGLCWNKELKMRKNRARRLLALPINLTDADKTCAPGCSVHHHAFLWAYRHVAVSLSTANEIHVTPRTPNRNQYTKDSFLSGIAPSRGRYLKEEKSFGKQRWRLRRLWSLLLMNDFVWRYCRKPCSSRTKYLQISKTTGSCLCLYHCFFLVTYSRSNAFR